MCQTVERLLYSPKIDANSVSTSHNEKPWTRACVHIASKDSWNTTMRLSPNSWHLRNSTVIKNGFLLSEIMHRDLSAHIGQTALTRTGPVVGQVHHILVRDLSSPLFSSSSLFFHLFWEIILAALGELGRTALTWTALTRTGPGIGQVHVHIHGLSSPLFSCFSLFFICFEKYFCLKFVDAVGGNSDRLPWHRPVRVLDRSITLWYKSTVWVPPSFPVFLFFLQLVWNKYFLFKISLRVGGTRTDCLDMDRSLTKVTSTDRSGYWTGQQMVWVPPSFPLLLFFFICFEK